MRINKVCPVCHRIFEARRKDQIYCTFHCRKKHHKEVYYSKDRIDLTIDEQNTNGVLRRFKCKKCQKMVIVVSKMDKRKVFCSSRCEKLYWKHAKK